MRFATLILSAAFVTPTHGGEPVDFARDVVPILSDYCYACHGPDEAARKADLRLDDRADLLRLDSPVVVAGKPAASELIRRLTTHDAAKIMPPPRSKKPLSAIQIDTLKSWVMEGAKWGTHWAFTAPMRPAIPPGEAHPIDALVRAKLADEKLTFSPEADARTLIRRVTLDLTGLPPTLAEVERFRFARSFRGADLAYRELVDRLLASPHYGERMAWDWLDAARYADTNGYQGDNERTAWPWRDWVVRAFNADLPYDRFTVMQLAGDLLPNATKDDILATAFLRNHPINGEGGRIPEENRVDYAMDMAETTGTVFMGLTFNCCRCHDHKFDPLKQSEYYGLMAFFNHTPVTGAGGNPFTEPVLAVPSKLQKVALDKANAAVNRASDAVLLIEKNAFPKQASRTWPATLKNATEAEPKRRKREVWDALIDQFTEYTNYSNALIVMRDANAARAAATIAIPRVMVMADQNEKRETYILDKGYYTKPGAVAPPVVPAALGKLTPKVKPDRLALANWLVAPGNPLTARVAVNRFWQQLFGVGLVKTSENFGVQSERPSHPELLDFLALEFQKPTTHNATAWSVKSLLKLMVTSKTYKQSSRASAESWATDPENRQLARGPRFRLPAWAIRDQALTIAGLLSPARGGAGVNSYQPAGIWEESTFGLKKYTMGHDDELYRRSLYTFWRRIAAPTQFFDSATRTGCSVRASRTNTPLHALATLNDPAYVEAARAFAEQVWQSADDDAARLDWAMRRVLARPPSDAECVILMESLTRLRAHYAADPTAAGLLLKVGKSRRDESIPVTDHAAWATICGILLNLDETLTKE